MSTQTQMQSEFVDGVKIVGKGVGLQRIRRITGYLVGTLDRFNNAKRAEVGDRVKHMGRSCGCQDREN